MSQSLAEWVGTIGNFLKSLKRVTQMAIVVSKVVSRTNNSNVEAINIHSLTDTGIQNWIFCLRVRSDK